MRIATFADVCKLTGYKPTKERVGFRGQGWAALYDEDMRLKELAPFDNLITKVGDNYYMERAATILGATTNIVSSTNASPIVVTATAHGLGVGDEVIVASHTTNTNANGTWNISAVTANTISLRGTTGNGVGGASGTVRGLALPPVTGMKLGTGTTAVAKSGAGAAIVTYATALTASLAIDATWPTATLDVPGCQIQYQTTWAAGSGTSGTNWGEVVLSNETPLADDAGTAANTVARALLSPTIAKAAGDTLIVVWNQIGLGA